MGLCKCPQRKVTNIFCYEHRVNVCEYCLMANHPKCVVDTYRNWITDSVFSPKCTLCSDDLVNGETVRLLCFHIVHWACLDNWARSLPPTTAPAGYTCPVCQRMCLFPALNQVSPIADALRSKMGEVNWARVGLGLPLLDSDVGSPAASNGLSNGTAVGPEVSHYNHKSMSHYDSSSSLNSSYSDLPQQHNVNADAQHQEKFFSGKITPGTHGGPSVIKNNQNANESNHVEASTSYASNHASFANASPSKSYYNDISNSSSNPNPRKPVNKFDYEMPLVFDEDEHKYRRKSPFEALSRWLKNANPTSNRRKSRRRTIIYALVTIVVVIIMFMILFGRNDEYDDPMNDPKMNPNVFIGDREAVGKGVGREDS